MAQCRLVSDNGALADQTNQAKEAHPTGASQGEPTRAASKISILLKLI